VRRNRNHSDYLRPGEHVGDQPGTRPARLAGLARLREVSETGYQDGVEYMMRVGPAGTTPGVSRLVRVRFTEPTAGQRREARIALA